MSLDDLLLAHARELDGPMSPAIRKILGFLCFEVGPAAHVYQAAGEFVGAGGEQLRRCAEDEQAFILHKMLRFWLLFGETWPDAMSADLKRAKATDSYKATLAKRASK